MAALIQTATTFGGTTTAPNVTFSQNITAGNAILAFVSGFGGSTYVVSVTDTQGNLYIALDPIIGGTQAWMAFGAKGGPCVITATLGSAVAGSAVKGAELSGLSGVLDNSVIAAGTSGNVSIGPITTTQAAELLIGYERSMTPTAAGAGWTATDLTANNIEWRSVSSIGTYNAQWVNSSQSYNGGFLAFQTGTILNPWITSDVYAGSAAFKALDPPGGFNAGNVLQYPRTQAWTIMSAIKMFNKPPSGGANIIFTNVIGGPPYSGYELWVDSNGFLHVRIIGNIASNYIGKIGSINVCDSVWHFVAATYDGSSTAAGVKIYLDGVLDPAMTVESDSLGTNSIVAAGQQVVIGNQNGRASSYFARGYIDEFSIHNIVRSAAYIAAISPTNLPAVDANVQMMYHFNEGQGAIAYDASANGFNATFPVPQPSQQISAQLTITLFAGGAGTGVLTSDDLSVQYQINK